jgi:hypothetical protein
MGETPVTDQLMVPHYAKIEGLQMRTAADFSDATMAGKSLEHVFKLDVARARPAQPSLIGSAIGRIDQLLLTVPAYAAHSLGYIYKDILRKLPDTTSFVIATHESTKGIVKQWTEECNASDRCEVFDIADHLHFSIWAEDGYVAAHDKASGKTYLIEPFSFPRYGDGLIADFVANATSIDNTQAPLYFQGGNVLIGDDFFLIGADYPKKSSGYIGDHLLPKGGENRADFIRNLYNDYLDRERRLIYIASTISVPHETEQKIRLNGDEWTEILYAGNHQGTVQPLFHIDMFLTLVGRQPGGKFKVLVGDPKLAAQELKEPVSPYAMQEVYDNVAKGMKNAGFEVERNPLPLVYSDDIGRKERTWYFATSNNCLVQNSQTHGKIVWIPTYGYGPWSKLAATDEANKRIWERMGFEVRQLGDFHPLASNLGALHCIKKYLNRSS